MNQMEDKKNSKNSSNSMVDGRWPQTKSRLNRFSISIKGWATCLGVFDLSLTCVRYELWLNKKSYWYFSSCWWWRRLWRRRPWWRWRRRRWRQPLLEQRRFEITLPRWKSWQVPLHFIKAGMGSNISGFRPLQALGLWPIVLRSQISLSLEQ